MILFYFLLNIAGKPSGTTIFDYVVEDVGNVALNTLHLIPDLGNTYYA